MNLSRRSPKLSHLFFADDLILFGEASWSQALLIQEILADFCGESDQKVNSKLDFSPKTPSGMARVISERFGVPLSRDLGM